MSSYQLYMGKRSETRVLYKTKKAIKDLDSCFEPKTDPEMLQLDHRFEMLQNPGQDLILCLINKRKLLVNCKNLSIHEIIRSCKNLRSLDLKKCDSVTDEAIDTLMSSNPRVDIREP
ncbi:14_t:CDS:1 [Paraglomus occultum]|uniref:14_t:CDS:1 n=1 Tax=Paraglomus occultum TaxID=144539 RepID=A0A9N9EBM5_9GLOM|nr:14_t:CDS:1 [Paraglomus occultum]